MKMPRGPRPPRTTADAFMKARRDILDTIQRIPRGQVASYSQIAFIAGWPGRARLVARVLSDIPSAIPGEAASSRSTPGPVAATDASRAGKDSVVVPWFRVINAQGKVAIPKSSPGHLQQIRLLKAEGVVFLNGRVSFEKQGWKPGDASPLLD